MSPDSMLQNYPWVSAGVAVSAAVFVIYTHTKIDRNTVV